MFFWNCLAFLMICHSLFQEISDPEIKPRFLLLQGDSLPSEPPRKLLWFWGYSRLVHSEDPLKGPLISSCWHGLRLSTLKQDLLLRPCNYLVHRSLWQRVNHALYVVWVPVCFSGLGTVKLWPSGGSCSRLSVRSSVTQQQSLRKENEKVGST